MFTKALLAFLLLPGIFAGILPLYLGLSNPPSNSGSLLGIFPMLIGLILLLWCVRDFYVSGKGTLAPWHPPINLVSTGLYQFTRNPMYLAVLTIILGQALFFHSTRVLVYLLGIAIAFHLRVLFNEEQWLKTQFGHEWEQYKSSAPRWLPRLTPFFLHKISTIREKN